MRYAWICLLPAMLAGGCGGYHVLTVPDQVAPAGGEANVVVRLQRSEIWLLAAPLRNAAMQLRIDEGPLRVTHTDRLGYAAAPVPAPDQPGTYPLHVFHQDIEGDEVGDTAPVYVWQTDRPVVAVDLAALPYGRGAAFASAADALSRLAERAHILYLTRRPVSEHDALHDSLTASGCPDGPMLLWRTQRWHIVREPWYLPRLVVEARMVSRLGELRRTLPTLTVGICRSQVAARSFREEGLECVVIDAPHVEGEVRRVESWSELPRQPL